MGIGCTTQTHLVAEVGKATLLKRETVLFVENLADRIIIKGKRVQDNVFSFFILAFWCNILYCANFGS